MRSLQLKAKFNTENAFLLISIAYFFSLSIRMIWIYFNGDNAQFIWNNQFIINTNDGYFWAEGARDIIAGFHQDFDLSPVDKAASWVTAIFYWITPFSLETVIFYLPMVLSSLIVVPIILIGRILGILHVSFITALLSSIAWSYYNRTMVGYFDTDMLNIVLPVFLLWSLVLAIKTEKDKYLLFMALDIILYRLWYPQSYSLEFAFFGLILFYVLVYERKNIYLLKLLTMLLLAMMGLPTIIRLFLVLAFYLLSKKSFYRQYIYYFLAVAFVIFLFSGGFDPIWNQLKGYVFRDVVRSLNQGLSLHFFSVMQTVSEANTIPFETFASRISGNIIIFFLSLVGFIWLAKDHKVMLLSLPLVGLGFLAYGIPGIINGAGLRFTIYAIVPLAFGVAFLLVQIAKIVSAGVEKNQRIVYFLIIFLGTVGVLYPNVEHVIDYQARPVMVKSEVETLDALKKHAQREDYTLAWWDYGYPIRFYSDTKTFADGGKHSGEANFPVTVALTQPQDISASMSRLTVEAYEKSFQKAKDAKDAGIKLERQNSTMQQFFIDNSLNSNEDLFEFLKNSPKLPEKTRDVYYYLPQRMSRIFEVVDKFKSIDIVSGKKLSGIFFKQPIGQQDGRIYFTRDIYMLRNGDIYRGREKLHLKYAIRVGYDARGKHKVQKNLQNMMGEYSLIMQGRSLYLLNDEALNSTYVQLFFFEQYDKRYFEPVIMSPYAKIYKLKI